jgi:hypothetical protein
LLTLEQVTDVNSADFRCYTSETQASAETIGVTAGSTLGIYVNDQGQGIYHQGVVNVYMAKAPSNVTGWDGSGKVWFKVHEITAKTDGGSTITFPAQGAKSVSFTVPKNLPNGQ